MDGTVPLSLLGQYKHVVWYTDETGAFYSSSPSDRSTPITALRLVNSPGRPVILSTYMTQGYGTDGGFVWLCGGGAAFAALIAWNKPNTSPLDYDSREPNPELRPGRMMYDFVHWREGVQMLPGRECAEVRHHALRSGNQPSRPPLAAQPAAADAARPRRTIRCFRRTWIPRTRRPIQRRRSANADSFWLRGNYNAEYINRPTFIREDYNDDPDGVSEYSTLDTLYIVRGGTALVNSPVMTYYHGRENQPMVFSGFNFWYWRRTQCIQLVDWVLQSVWGLPRDPEPRTATGPMTSQRASR